MTVVIQMQQGKTKTRPPHGPPAAAEIDCYVGQRLRQRRILLGWTQKQIAARIGVTYQQAYKYEKGMDRIAAGRLYNIAQVLGVGLDYFFEGYAGPGKPPPEPGQKAFLNVSSAYLKLTPKHRKAVDRFIHDLAGESHPQDDEVL
jgi:transcriptional regulator with XRE-family HTH domain